MKVIKDVTYGNFEQANKLDIYLPDGKASSVFLYFHGGGLIEGDKATDAKVFAPFLVEHNIAVISANYRMYPEAEYPDFIIDAAEAVAWADKYMKDNLGCDKLYVGGSSAGGYITMMLCFDSKYLKNAGIDNSHITAYFHDAGQPTAHFTVLKNKGIDSRRIIIDETAPLYHIGLEKEYPPMRFIVSDNDIPNRYEQTMMTLATLSNFGYTGFDHVVIHGNHCEYCAKTDEDGIGVFGKMVYDFIQSVKK